MDWEKNIKIFLKIKKKSFVQTKHALLVGFGDFATSLFCGAVVFTMIGYMASALNKPIEQIVQDGAGKLVFYFYFYYYSIENNQIN